MRSSMGQIALFWGMDLFCKLGVEHPCSQVARTHSYPQTKLQLRRGKCPEVWLKHTNTHISVTK